MNAQPTGGATRQSVLFLVDLGRFDEARPMVGLLLAESPDDLELLGAMVRCARGLGDKENALAYSELMVAAAPDSEWGHRLLALSLAAIGRRQDGLEQAWVARRLQPNSWEPHQAVALIAVDIIGHRKEATKVAEDCVRLAPGVPEAHVTQGIVAERRGRNKQAVECYRRALGLDPQHEDALRRLANLEAQTNWVRGANTRTRLLGVDPTDRQTATQMHRVLRGVRFLLAFVVGLALFVNVYSVTFPGADARNVLEVTALVLLVGVIPLVVQISRLEPRARRLVLGGASGRARAGAVLLGVGLALALAACAVPEAARWLVTHLGGPEHARLGPLTGGGGVRMTVERVAVGGVALTLAVLVWSGLRRRS